MLLSKEDHIYACEVPPVLMQFTAIRFCSSSRAMYFSEKSSFGEFVHAVQIQLAMIANHIKTKKVNNRGSLYNKILLLELL